MGAASPPSSRPWSWPSSPDEALAELRREWGDRVPLTNLFSQGEGAKVGLIRVHLTDAADQPMSVEQEVRQELYSLRPSRSGS